MRIQNIKTKNLITRSKLPDANFVINPYIGCNHGCVYCYAEFMSRFTGHSGERWGEFMDVKECAETLPLKLIAGKSVLIGSVTDPYNPLEKRYEKTRDILRQLQDAGARLEILTKSPLVTRDIDLLSRMNDAHVGISLSSTDENFVRLTERNAAAPRQRLETIRALSEAGVNVYAFISPIFPFFSDWRLVVDQVSGFTETVCFENLNLRGGYRRAVLDLIARHYPDKAESFTAIYHDKTAFFEYWQETAAEIDCYMAGKPHKIYFFHEAIRK